MRNPFPWSKIQESDPSLIIADQESPMSNITVLEYVVITDVEILFLIALRPRKLFLYFANYIFYANTGESNNPKLQHIIEVLKKSLNLGLTPLPPHCMISFLLSFISLLVSCLLWTLSWALFYYAALSWAIYPQLTFLSFVSKGLKLYLMLSSLSESNSLLELCRYLYYITICYVAIMVKLCSQWSSPYMQSWLKFMFFQYERNKKWEGSLKWLDIFALRPCVWGLLTTPSF